MDRATLEPALLLRRVSFLDLDLPLPRVELGLARPQALVGAGLELLSQIVELGFADTDRVFALEQQAVGVAELGLAALQELDAALDLPLAGGDLFAEGLFPLGDADALDLELGDNALLAVARLGLGLDELFLELCDPRAGLVERCVAVVELVDELLGALLGFRGARAVALEVVQDLGELLAAVLGQVVDDVARGRGRRSSRDGCAASTWPVPKNRPRRRKL